MGKSHLKIKLKKQKTPYCSVLFLRIMNRVFVTSCVYPPTKKNKGTALFQAKKRIHTQQGLSIGMQQGLPTPGHWTAPHITDTLIYL